MDLFGNNKWHIDGALSAAYAIPEDQDPEKIVRISPFPFVPVDIRMPFLPWFHCWNAFFPVDAKRSAELFAHGYKTARAHHELFLEKGFTLRERPDRRGLSKHKKQFEHVAALATKKQSLLRNPNSNPVLTDSQLFERLRSPGSQFTKSGSRERLTRNSRSFVGLSNSVPGQKNGSAGSLLSSGELSPDEDSQRGSLVQGSMRMARHLNT